MPSCADYWDRYPERITAVTQAQVQAAAKKYLDPARLHIVAVKLGDRLEFIVPHCDPSVNLYDSIHCLRGDRVEAIWPVAARGMSQ